MESERRLNMRTISADTKARLCRAADEAHGWKLKQTKEEMLRIRERAQVKEKRLLDEKKIDGGGASGKEGKERCCVKIHNAT